MNHDEAESGSIEVGKRADLAVLDRDIFNRYESQLGKMHVVMTIAGGRVVHNTA